MTAPDEAATLFEYSKAEWAEIEASAQIVKKGALRKSTRKALQTAACAYLSAVAQHDKKSRQKDCWAKVDTLSQRLQRELSVCVEWCNNDSCDEWRKLRADWASAGLAYVNIIGALARRARHDLEGKGNPRLEYQSKVLEIWVQLGGSLRISRHNRSQRVQGPLAKYFFAVARPVMGEATPSSESLPGIVKRQKLSTAQTEGITQRSRWYDFRAIDFRAIYNWLYPMEADNEQTGARLKVIRTIDSCDHAEYAVKPALSGNGAGQKE